MIIAQSHLVLLIEDPVNHGAVRTGGFNEIDCVVPFFKELVNHCLQLFLLVAFAVDSRHLPPHSQAHQYFEGLFGDTFDGFKG